MILNNGRYIDRYVHDSSGPKAFVMYISNCFDPTTYLVRGDSFEDAYECFLCDPRVEKNLAIDPVKDYADYGYESVEAFEKAYMDCETVGIIYNDNNVLVNDEAVCIDDLSSFAAGNANG